MLLVAVLSLGIGLGWYALRGANQRPVATGPNVVVLVLDGMDLWTWQRLPELRGPAGGPHLHGRVRHGSGVVAVAGEHADRPVPAQPWRALGR